MENYNEKQLHIARKYLFCGYTKGNIGKAVTVRSIYRSQWS